jgi:signal transduction histidine kinase
LSDHPWIQCPCCFYPIEIPNGDILGEYECGNPTCPLASHTVRGRVFPSHEEARKDKKGNCGVFQIGEIRRFFDIEDRPTDYWGYFFINSPSIDRFRLVERQPLARLVSQGIVADWATGTAWRKKMPFSVLLVSYDPESGEVVRDSSGRVVLSPSVPDPEAISRPDPAGYCPACRLFRDWVVDKHLQNDNAFVDPCLKCNKSLASKLFDAPWKGSYVIRRAAANPSYQNKSLFDALHHRCWLGLVDLAFPVMVADIVVAVVFTGQLRIEGYELSPKQEGKRNDFLRGLGATGQEILDAFSQMNPQATSKLQEAYTQLREPAHELQMLASGRYGQMGSIRSNLLGESLSSRARKVTLDGGTKWTAYADIGGGALQSLAKHFSFDRAALLVNEGGKWEVAACHPAAPSSLPLDPDVTLPDDPTGVPDPATTAKVFNLLWPGKKDINAYDFWVRENSSTWFLFADRRYPNHSPSSWMNVTSRYLLTEAARAFHREMTRQLAIFRQVENVLSVAHNLKTPMAGIESALGSFDATVYHKHLRDMIKLSYRTEYSFLDEALKTLYERIHAARRRADYEIQKMEHGTSIDVFLKEPAAPIRVVADPQQGSKSALEALQPLALWESILSSFKMYEGEMRGRDLVLETPPNPPKSLKARSVFINPGALQLVVDNLADNAVKYSFEGEEIAAKMDYEIKNGKEYCMLSVSNFGNGILPREKDKVWTLFYRGHHSTTKKLKVTGTGLGMHLIKRIVEHYGGFVDVESTFGGATNINPGEGFKTTVTIALPLLPK